MRCGSGHSARSRASSSSSGYRTRLRDSLTNFTRRTGFSPSNVPAARQRLNSALSTASSRLTPTGAPLSMRARLYRSTSNALI